MAETILKGYVINKIPYKIFDEIVTFLSINGQKYVCLSLGSKKIESKNGRNLFLGSLVEFHFFKTRTEGKISKLKKVITIKPVNWNHELLESFNLLNECVNKLTIEGDQIIIFYEDCLQMITKSFYDEYRIILIILYKTCLLNGIKLEVNRCVRCGAKKLKTISFKDHGMICTKCFNKFKDKLFDLNTSKLIHLLFNEKYDEMTQFSSEYSYVIKLLKNFINDYTGIDLKTLINY